MTTLRSTLLLPVLVAMALAACSATGPSSRVTTLVGGPDAAAILAGTSPAVTRTAYRIDGMAFVNDTAEGAEETIQGFPVLAGPVDVDPTSAATLADVFLDDDTYLWDLAKGCEFLPGVAIRQVRAGTTVDVLICFSCDEIETFVNGAKAGHEDVDPRRADLVRVAQRLFPDDAAIRKLR